MSERLAHQVHALGLQEKAVVVAGGTLDAEVRPAGDLDLAVDPETYHDLRESYDWEEVRASDGRPLLRRDNVEVGIGWGARTTHDLQSSSHDIAGVRFAGWPEVYAWKQERAQPKDLADLAAMRARLYHRPLPVYMLHREAGLVHEAAPADLPDHAALTVAANGLYLVRTIFGEHQHGVHAYSGSVETGLVPATYHEFWHSAGGVQRLGRHIAQANQGRLAVGRAVLFTPADSYASLTAFAYHDSRMGDGRASNNPTGFDELRAAELAARHLTLAGCTAEDMPQKSYVGIRATGFNEATMTQDIDLSRGYEHIQTAIARADLGTFAEPRFTAETIRLIVENLCRIGAGYDRVLARSAEQHGVRITNVQQGLALIDASPSLLTTFGEHLLQSANFCARYDYGDQWTQDNPVLRQANALFTIRLAEAILRGELTASQAYTLAMEYAEGQ